VDFVTSSTGAGFFVEQSRSLQPGLSAAMIPTPRMKLKASEYFSDFSICIILVPVF
jgi:hypothetical protein